MFKNLTLLSILAISGKAAEVVINNVSSNLFKNASNSFITNINSRLASTNGTAFNLTINGGTVSGPLTNKYVRVPNIIYYGATAGGGAAYSAITNSLAQQGELVFPAGTWDISADVNISQTNKLVVEEGALLRPATNVTVTVRGDVDAPLRQWIDLTHWVEGKGIIFSSLGVGSPVALTPDIWLNWFGASPNNSSSADTKAFKAWMYSTPSSFANTKKIDRGVYRIDDTILVSNKFRIVGVDLPQITFSPSGSSKAMFEVAASSDDVWFTGLNLISAATSATNTFTNLVGIKYNGDCDRLYIADNYFQRFNNAGVLLDGSTSGSLYGVLERNLFLDMSNDTSDGGNSLHPAYGLTVTNLVVGLNLINNRFNRNDSHMYVYAQGGTNGAQIILNNNFFENAGKNGYSASNALTFITKSVSLNDVYLEGNSNTFGIWFENGRSVSVRGKNIASDFSNILYTKSSLGFSNVLFADVSGVAFNNTTNNFIAQYGSGVVNVSDCWFDLGGATNITPSQVMARISGNVSVKSGTYVYPKELTYAATTDVNFAQSDNFTVTLAGNITFTTSGRNSGGRATLRVIGDGSIRNYTLPSWKFIGSTPTTLAANKTGVFYLNCYGTAETDVVAFYQVEP